MTTPESLNLPIVPGFHPVDYVVENNLKFLGYCHAVVVSQNTRQINYMADAHSNVAEG
jgi:hypothetical protein